MTQEHTEALRKLSELSATAIGDNENNVKYNFIIPFLEALGYNKQLYFEHSAQGSINVMGTSFSISIDKLTRVMYLS